MKLSTTNLLLIFILAAITKALPINVVPSSRDETGLIQGANNVQNHQTGTIPNSRLEKRVPKPPKKTPTPGNHDTVNTSPEGRFDRKKAAQKAKAEQQAKKQADAAANAGQPKKDPALKTERRAKARLEKERLEKERLEKERLQKETQLQKEFGGLPGPDLFSDPSGQAMPKSNSGVNGLTKAQKKKQKHPDILTPGISPNSVQKPRLTKAERTAARAANQQTNQPATNQQTDQPATNQQGQPMSKTQEKKLRRQQLAEQRRNQQGLPGSQRMSRSAKRRARIQERRRLQAQNLSGQQPQLPNQQPLPTQWNPNPAILPQNPPIPGSGQNPVPFGGQPPMAPPQQPAVPEPAHIGGGDSSARSMSPSSSGGGGFFSSWKNPFSSSSSSGESTSSWSPTKYLPSPKYLWPGYWFGSSEEENR